MKQTQAKSANQTADTKTSDPSTQQEAQNLQLFPGPFCGSSCTEHCEKGADPLDGINELEAIQACCSAEWGHKPGLHCRGLWCWATAICPVLSLKAADTPAFCALCPKGLAALCHQMVKSCCEGVRWKENSALHRHYLNYLTDKPVPGKGEGLEGEAFTKVGGWEIAVEPKAQVSLW